MVRGIPGDWIVAALAADAEWVRTSRRVLFTSPARDQVRVMLEAAAPLIAAAERERAEAAEARLAALAAAIPPERFRKMADWFDTDDEFKMTMFPGTWPPGSRLPEVQGDLRKFASLLEGGTEGQDRGEEKGPGDG